MASGQSGDSAVRFPAGLRARADGNLLNSINGIEKFHVLVSDVSSRHVATFDPIALGKAPPQEFIGKALELLLSIYATKYRELVGAAIEATCRSEFLVFAYCGRGLIETTATLNYYNTKIIAVITAAKDPDSFHPDELKAIVELLDAHSRGGRFDWASFWTDSRKDMASRLVEARRSKKQSSAGGESYVQQVNIQTAIDHWIKDEPGIALFYDFYCELVHPNLGSNFLVMGASDGQLSVGGTVNKSVARSIVREGITFLGPVLKRASGCMASLVAWAALTRGKNGEDSQNGQVSPESSPPQ